MCTYDINQELKELNILMEADQLAGQLERIQKALDHCIKTKQNEHLPSVYMLMGHQYERSSDYSNAIDAFETGLQLAEDENQSKVCMDIYRELGNLHSDLGQRSKALYYYFNGLEHLKNDDYAPVKEASFSNNIGTVYRDMSRYDQALPFFLDAYSILKNEKETLKLSIISSNVAETYYFLGELELSKKYNELSRNYAEEAAVPSTITYSSMMQFIYALEETDDLEAFDVSYKTFIEKIYKESVVFDIIYYHYTIGKALYKIGKWDLAETDLLKAYELAIENSSIAQTGGIQDMLQKIYELRGDYENAYRIAHEAVKDLKQIVNHHVDSEYRAVKKHLHHITNAKQMDHLEDSVRIFKLLSEIGEEINRNMNIEGIFRHILSKLYDIWDLDTFGLAILQDDRVTMDYYYHSVERGLRIGTRTVGDDSIMGYCLESQNEIIIADSLNQRNYHNQLPEEYLKLILDSNVQSLIFLPLFIDGALLGGITVQSTLREYFSAKDIEILKTLGASCATAVTNYRRHQELLRIKDIDGLTGSFNRQALIAYNESIDQKRIHLTEPVLIAMCDIDYFKEYNDTYGHLLGDRCLITITSIIQEAINPYQGKLFRYGGDEFIIVIEDMNRPKASMLMKAIKENVKKADIEHKMSPIEGHITLSLGSAVIGEIELESLVYFDAVDAALYAVKAKGRNGYKLVDC